MDDISSRVAIVIPSCDKYEDLWVAAFEFLRRRWPACPFQVFLISNHLECTSHEITTVKVGLDQGWSANLINALDFIPHDYVFLVLDDLFIHIDVASEKITEMI